MIVRLVVLDRGCSRAVSASVELQKDHRVPDRIIVKADTVRTRNGSGEDSVDRGQGSGKPAGPKPQGRATFGSARAGKTAPNRPPEAFWPNWPGRPASPPTSPSNPPKPLL
jgi:hypothetical protein